MILDRCAFGCGEPVRDGEATVSCGPLGVGHESCRDVIANQVKAYAAAKGESSTSQAEPVGGASPKVVPVEPAKEET